MTKQNHFSTIYHVKRQLIGQKVKIVPIGVMKEKSIVKRLVYRRQDVEGTAIFVFVFFSCLYIGCSKQRFFCLLIKINSCAF